MALVENDDVIEEFASDTPDPALRNAVLPRTAVCRSGRPDAEGLHYRDDPSAEDGVAVENGVVRRGVVRNAWRSCWTTQDAAGCCDIEMKNASLRVNNREPDIEDAEGGRWYGEEVHRRDGAAVVAQEREPALECARAD